MTYLQRHKYSRKAFGDIMDPIEIDSTPKRTLKKRVWLTLWIILAVALIVFLAVRFAHAANCVQTEGKLYVSTNCGNDTCCQSIPQQPSNVPWGY